VKTCPDCSATVHDMVAACPEYGGRWNADGTYAGVPEATPASTPVEQPRTVAEMSPGQLLSHIVLGTFGGVLLAGVTLLLALWLLGLMLSSD